MYQLDASMTQWINSWVGQSAILDFLMIWVSVIGVPVLVLLVAIQWWFPRRDPSTRHVLVAAGVTFLFGLAINQFILLFVHRLRPYDTGVTHLLIGRSADFSFPSDHATAVCAIAAAFLFHRRRRFGLAFLAAALLVIVSRVYVGTHYVSDVIGGAITGIIAAVCVRLIYRESTKIDRFITNLL